MIRRRSGKTLPRRKQWRGSSNPPAEVCPADDVVFRPPSEADKITHKQNKVSWTGPHKAPDEGPHKTQDDTAAAQC